MALNQCCSGHEGNLRRHKRRDHVFNSGSSAVKIQTPLLTTLAAASLVMFASSAFAAQTYNNLRGTASLPDAVPTIIAGNPPDSPSGRVDPNLTTSPWAGVVSINIRYSGSSFICSGSMISPIHVLTAGHCVDTTDAGTVIDITQPGNDVRVVFNTQATVGGTNTFTLATATAVAMNPNYQGFGPCPVGVSGFCLNDDLAVITLNAAQVPSWVPIYAVGGLNGASPQTMVGYGVSGTGTTGGTVSPSFFVKRTGGNYSDLFDLNDEANFTGAREVWQSDFDGNGIDSHCTIYGVCSPALANNVETALGGGDSGGPSFQQIAGQWVVVGNNTYGTTFDDVQVQGTFGTGSGGMELTSYIPWLQQATGGLVVVAVPEPESYAMMVLGLLAIGAAARRRRNVE